MTAPYNGVLAAIRDGQGWAKRQDVVRASGPMAVDGLLSKGLAKVDPSDDTLQLTEAGVRACEDLLR